ncbi:5'/3'-nucleotidase SurE [Pendulispora brunnea]|uniref:5'-nucleotidase n=1 Tax=Pendulispora brunnea TaxID=2905690 RepID=A0ABZ2K0X6_9BACT
MTRRRWLWPSLFAQILFVVSCSSGQEPGEEKAAPEQVRQGEESLALGDTNDDAPIRLDIDVRVTTPSAAPRPLKILLSNDDGYSDPGIQAMKRGLRAAGHAVTLVAPAQDRSGSSVSVTGPAPVNATTQADGDMAVEGSPATSVLVGIAVLEARGEKPDLIVSGPNFGFDGGPSTPYSGTMGAATAGLIRGVPSIAVMADPIVRDKTDPAFIAHVERVAAFTARLIERLETKSKDGALLPQGVGLKLGYPALPIDKIAGVTMVNQGKTGLFHLVYKETSPGVFSSAKAPFEPVTGDENGEVVNFRAGYITVMPFVSDLTANRRARHQVRHQLGNIKP